MARRRLEDGSKKARRWFVDGSSMARIRLEDGSKMVRRRLVKVIGFLRPCKSATLRSHYPSPKAVPTSLYPSSRAWVHLGYTLGRVCEICSEHYTCRLAYPRLNDSGSKENLRHNCATIVRVLRHNCSAVAQQSPVRLCVSRGGHRYFRPGPFSLCTRLHLPLHPAPSPS
jgi:hypothetical protein